MRRSETAIVKNGDRLVLDENISGRGTSVFTEYHNVIGGQKKI